MSVFNLIVPDIVDVFVGTPLATSDHWFVSCVLRVEQSVPEYNMRSTVFLKRRSNWDNVRFAGMQDFSCSPILKSADQLGTIDRAVGEVIGRLVPTTDLSSRSGENQWFDASCRRACDAKQIAYHARCRARSEDHWGRFVLARAEAQRVYGAARESHNEWTRNPLKHSSCSHKWWETLKGSIFGVKPSIPALRGTGSGLVVAPGEKASLLGCQFDSKQCVSSSSHHCLVSLIIGAILWPSGLLSFCICFLILTHMVVLIVWVCFLYF